VFRDHAAGSMKTSGKTRLSRKRSLILKYRSSSAKDSSSAPTARPTSATWIHSGDSTHHHDQSVTPASLSARKTTISGVASTPGSLIGLRSKRTLMGRA
jgi:hypothetical protein